MVNYGLDLDKIEMKFQDLLVTNEDKIISEFAKEIIPLLINDNKKVRMEYMNLLIKK